MSSINSQFASANMRGSEQFPSPFLDMASLAMPDENRNVLDWCEYIFQSNSTYRMAIDRIVSYFLTSIDITAAGRETVGDDEKDKWKTFLNEDLKAIACVKSMDVDRACYGNAFASLFVPFRRFLFCKKCKLQLSWKTVTEGSKFRFKFDLKSLGFLATCPKCHHHGNWGVRDEPDKDEKKLKIKVWNPKQIEIKHDDFSGDCQYLWRIPETYKQDIRSGVLFALERASMEVLKAVRDDSLFQFANDVIYHMKEPTLAGICNRGWGISRTLTNFRQVWYVQVLHRYNEAIALDYVIPFRLITPAPQSGSGIAGGMTNDPLLSTNMGDFTGQVRRMIRQRRRDPASWHTLPFPVQYQALGGDATQLAPKELLDQGMETLLNGIGTPMELYRGSLATQAAPVALRLHEATWAHLVYDNNAFLRWLVNQISEVLSWEQVSAQLQSVTIADDIQKQMMLMQLMMGGVISQGSGLQMLGIDFKSERRRIAEESRFDAEQQAEVQEEMEQAAFGQQIAKGTPGGAAPPGAGGQPGAQPQQGQDPNAPQQPPGPVTGLLQSMGPNTPVTPQDMMSEAESLAQQLLGLPESQKRSELLMLKQKNEAMWSLVKAKMQTIRSRAQTAGGAQILGGGGQPQQ